MVVEFKSSYDTNYNREQFEVIKGVITNHTKNQNELRCSGRVIVPVPPHAILLQYINMLFVYLYINDIDLLRCTNDVCKVSYTTIHHFMKRKYMYKKL